ncbi:MAG: peptidylprolyl isomerase [bacterium]|nr:peptidylprolyl isomerase [bacterium]
MQKFISLYLLLSASFGGSMGAQTLSRQTIVLETSYGTLKLKLYEETPLHKANFLKLVHDHFFDSLLFHRVINNFMIQSGDPLSKKAGAGDSLGHGDIGYTLPAEFNPKLFHKKGTLCAARESDEINPQKASSASQFYLVMGKKRTLEDLAKYEDRINKTHYTNCAREFMKTEEGKNLKNTANRMKFENKTDSALVVNAHIEEMIKAQHLMSPEYRFDKAQIDAYTTGGGTPHLDGTYTVFGEVVEGMEVIDKIAAVPTDTRDRPLKDIRLKMWVLEE